ncbi:unnamed protein product [Moneuplotes crassus]|uniref:Uncharacterized protein n=1 Tax=Euplotes crassus TaxID=5936 RepID=A0AAD1UE92_EUPCR|nr:unnamed protein product [Moneuplotes crassus]
MEFKYQFYQPKYNVNRKDTKAFRIPNHNNYLLKKKNDKLVKKEELYKQEKSKSQRPFIRNSQKFNVNARINFKNTNMQPMLAWNENTQKKLDSTPKLKNTLSYNKVGIKRNDTSSRRRNPYGSNRKFSDLKASSDFTKMMLTDSNIGLFSKISHNKKDYSSRKSSENKIKTINMAANKTKSIFKDYNIPDKISLPFLEGLLQKKTIEKSCEDQRLPRKTLIISRFEAKNIYSSVTPSADSTLQKSNSQESKIQKESSAVTIQSGNFCQPKNIVNMRSWELKKNLKSPEATQIDYNYQKDIKISQSQKTSTKEKGIFSATRNKRRQLQEVKKAIRAVKKVHTKKFKKNIKASRTHHGQWCNCQNHKKPNTDKPKRKLKAVKLKNQPTKPKSPPADIKISPPIDFFDFGNKFIFDKKFCNW